MATKNGIERTYVDFAVIDFEDKRLIAESHSSILMVVSKDALL